MWLIIAIAAYLLLGASAVLDKVVLTRPIPQPLLYVTYVGLVSSYAVILIPLGFAPAGLAGRWDLIFMALASGMLNITALIPFYSAVKKGEVSRVTPFVGVLAAVFTLIFGVLLGVEKLDLFQFLIFLILIGGALLVGRPRFEFLGILAGVLFGLSLVLAKAVYQETSFLNGFILARGGEVLVGLSLFLWPKNRAALRANWHLIHGKIVSMIGLAKILVSSGFLLQHYAIFLGSVILVQALTGLQYVFVWLIVLVVALFWKRVHHERFVLATLLILIGFLALAFSQKPTALTPGVQNWGVTFSKPWAETLGLDWRKSYLAILDDLGVKSLRLPAYWTEIEKSEGIYSFDDLDWQIKEAGNHGAKIILAVGRKLPRWPECYEPAWALNEKPKAKNEKLLHYIQNVIERYRNNPAIKYWQVENEPFLKFGVCPKFDKEFLDKELALVRSLDSRPVIVTDSGELSIWLPAAKRADIFGTTMYRTVWSEKLPGSGYLRYPLSPQFFFAKANLIKYFAGAKDIVVSELQAEPWGPRPIYELPPEEAVKSMDLEKFRENIEFAKSIGFREVYLWGAEWWYKEKLEGRDGIWNSAKSLFKE